LTRTSGIADADTRDFVQVDGIWVHKIQRKHRSPDQRLKTKASTRDMPYGEYPVQELKAAIEWVKNPLAIPASAEAAD
jgi:hypothetical protein